MNLESIKSILTLRYDYTQKPILPKISYNDFEKKQDFSSDDIERKLLKNLVQKIPNEYTEPISISLSGGIDSTLMLILLKKLFPNNQINAISIKFQDSIDETEIASKIAKKIGVSHHVIEVENFLEKLNEAISITKLPFWDIHWIYVVENAKNYSNFLVSGDGGDELFGGYIFRYSKFLEKINHDISTYEKINLYLSCHERDFVPEQREIFTKKMNFKWNDIHKQLFPFFNNSLTPIEQIFLADYNGKLLYNFSIINSALAKKFNINNVTPFLSSDLILDSMKIPASSKYDSKSNFGKLLLRKILKKYQLDDLISQQKLGFSVNTENLWKNHGYELVSKFLLDGQTIQDGWINNDWVKTNLNNRKIDVRHINKFFGLLAFEIWYRKFCNNN